MIFPKARVPILGHGALGYPRLRVSLPAIIDGPRPPSPRGPLYRQVPTPWYNGSPIMLGVTWRNQR